MAQENMIFCKSSVDVISMIFIIIYTCVRVKNEFDKVCPCFAPVFINQLKSIHIY